ncbi:MAG TPA: PorV/PorQ family protein, partial [Bacteroidota bacterium]
MNISRLSATTILVAALTGITSAQYNADFQSLLYPRSILSAGLGEQGVALRSSLEAMQYNPANLVYSEGLGISFFRNPVNMLNVVSGGMPMTYLSLSSSIGTFGNAAIEYTYWDIGEFYVSTAQNPSATTKEHFFEQSFAGAYAFSLSDRFDLGAQIRYARHDHNQGEHLLFSTGITFRPDGFSDRLTAGLSLMNFGTRINYPSIVDTVNSRSIEYEISTAPPAQLNLGVNAIAVTNNWFDVTLSFGATKPFARYLDSGAESSFKSLFSNWGAFPRDVTGQIGLGFLWHPLEIVRGISYLQEV